VTIALPDLDRECGRCQGNGIVTTPEWLEWETQANAVEAAWKARYPGRSWFGSTRRMEIEDAQPDPEMSCPECDGKGSIPTDAGRAVLRFLSVHGKG
jgi:hypothetical protein